MRRTAVLALAAAVVLPLSVLAQTNGYYDRSYVRMSYVQGDVYVQRTQDLGYEQGQVNLVVVQGDKLGTKAGRLEVQLGLRNYLRLDNETQVEMAGLPAADGQPTKIHILGGGIYLRVASMDVEKGFEIHTPDASFYILREGLYRIDVRQSRETELSVFEGAAEAAGQEGSIAVAERQRVSAADGRFTSEPLSLMARRDDFSAWNDTREALFARSSGQSASYLPAEYSDYATELDDNGSWVNEADYGYVWVPRVLDSVWRPYSSGRWVWYPIIGWTWVSYDSWGWCTDHYGRWGWGMNLGWYWIPRNHWGWGPAWVNWWYDGDYIGWCPLSYYNRPCVILNNRFYDRYDRYDFRSYSRTLNVVNRNQFQNRRLNGAMVGADRFAGRADNINFRADQPNVRSAAGGDAAINARANQAFGGRNARTVERGYTGNGQRLSADQIRSSGARGGEAATGAGSRVIRDGGSAARTEDPGRAVSGRTQDGSARTIRSYPTQGDRGTSAGSSSTRRIESGSENRISSSGAIRSNERSAASSSSARTIRSYPSSGSSSSRNSSGSSRISSSSSSSSRGTSSRASGSSMREYPSSSSSRSSSSASRISSGSSRSSSSSSGAVSRSSSREYPSSSSSSRSYSAPSSSSRSYSAPSRSSSSSSRSYSAPSRSSSSSGSSSRSSGGGSSSRSSSGSSSRSSGGSSRRR
ncbi:MAG: hypothetical protein NTZ26_00520 [Candidatus Aminicenantes bacterium]|nr:hypothetical protein [Candidatus Aminicenantes bacterium]